MAGVFGIQGELKCDPTSAGRMLFASGARFDARFADGSLRSIEIESVREHKNRLLLRMPGVESANQAEQFAGATLFAERSRIELEPDEFLDRDLIGCELYDANGTMLGVVERVEHYPASDMLVSGGKMVPMIAQFVKAIDVTAKRITLEVPPGLLDDSQAL